MYIRVAKLAKTRDFDVVLRSLPSIDIDASLSTTDPKPFAPGFAMPSLRRSALWNLLGDGLPLAVGVVALRLLIPRLHDDRFAVLSLAWTAIAFFGMFDLGLGRALTQCVSRRLRADDVRDLGPTIWTALGLILALGLAGGAIVGSIAPRLVDWLATPATLAREARGVFYLLAAAVPLVLLTSGLRGLLEAFGQFGRLAILRVVTGTAVYLAPLLLLPFTTDLVAIVAALVLVRLVGMLLHLHAYLTLAPRACTRWGVRRAAAGELLAFGGWITVGNLVGPVVLYVDRFIIARLVALSAVAYYGTPCDLILRLLFVPAAVAGALFPTLSAALVIDPDAAMRAMRSGFRLIAMTLAPAAIVIAAAAPEAIGLWLGPAWAGHSGRVMQILAIALFIGGMSMPLTALVHACGRPAATALLQVVQLPAHVGVVALLTWRWGIAGTAVALVLRVAIEHVALLAIAARLVPASRGTLRAVGLATTVGASALLVPASVSSARVRIPLGAIYLIASGLAPFVGTWRRPAGRASADDDVDPRSVPMNESRP